MSATDKTGPQRAITLVNPATGIGGDNVHPNDVGYTAIGDVIWPAIRRVAGYA